MAKFKKILGMMVLIVGIFAGLSLAQAQDAPGPGDGNAPKMHPPRHIQEIFKQLNLTDDQKKQLEANKKQHRAIMEKIHQEMKTNKEAFETEMMKTQLDMDRVKELHNQIKILQDQMEDDRLSSILAVRAILTPEQFTKFVELMHKRKPEHP